MSVGGLDGTWRAPGLSMIVQNESRSWGQASETLEAGRQLRGEGRLTVIAAEGWFNGDPRLLSRMSLLLVPLSSRLADASQ